MALDIDKLIADAKAARRDAEAKKAAADKVAAAIKTSNKANRDFKLQADNKLNYANSLANTIKDFEGQLTVFARQIARDGKLGPVEQKEFNRILDQYEKVNVTYSKTIDEANKILASAPSPAKVEVKGGKAEVGMTAEQQAATPAPAGAGTTGATVEEVNKQLDQQIKDSRKFIIGMSGPERKAFAQTLKDAGYNVTPTEGFQDALVLQYQAALQIAKSQNTNNKDLLPPVDFGQFLTERTVLANELKGIAGAGGAGGTGGTQKSVNISAPTEAAGLIQPLFKSLLGRDATANEVKNITKILNTAEKDPKNAVKTVTDANGNVTYSGGLDRGQFITQIIETVPEFKTKKADKATITTQDLITTANANGIRLSQDQINGWTTEVQNGGDINVIKNKIRSIASMGQPDTIKKLMAEGTDLESLYAPYKQRMASSLGVNVNTITLDDPTLRMAIGPDKEMSLYEFSKAIRKDNRWKYSQEANDEVTSMIDQVKRDFGFVG